MEKVPRSLVLLATPLFCLLLLCLLYTGEFGSRVVPLNQCICASSRDFFLNQRFIENYLTKHRLSFISLLAMAGKKQITNWGESRMEDQEKLQFHLEKLVKGSSSSSSLFNSSKSI